MRRTPTTLHPQLSRILSETGHVDELVVSDAGLPLPLGVERVDLAYRAGEPPLLSVLDTVLAELAVEGAVMAEEVVERSPDMYEPVRERLRAHGVEVQLVPHTALKQRTHGARAIVRSGEFTSYSSVILVAGVTY